jgi:hypothetical protein
VIFLAADVGIASFDFLGLAGLILEVSYRGRS